MKVSGRLYIIHTVVLKMKPLDLFNILKLLLSMCNQSKQHITQLIIFVGLLEEIT